MTHVTCRLLPRTGIRAGTLRSAIEYWLPLPLLFSLSAWLNSASHLFMISLTFCQTGGSRFVAVISRLLLFRMSICKRYSTVSAWQAFFLYHLAMNKSWPAKYLSSELTVSDRLHSEHLWPLTPNSDHWRWRDETVDFRDISVSSVADHAFVIT